MPRIPGGRPFLDRLPYWLALPAGLFLGLYIGYRASMPGSGVVGAALAVLGLGLAALLAWRAPRPMRRRARATASEPAAAGTQASAGIDDSLCG